MSLALVGLKVMFSLLLVILMLSIWAVVQGKRPHPWLLWVKDALIPTAIIVGLIHVVVLTFLVIRARQRGNTRAVWDSVKRFLRLMFFEWSILNATSLFVSLSSIGFPGLGYDFHVAFIVTVTTGLIHYIIFVRFYLARKPFVLWRPKDLAFVMFPLLLSSVIAFGIVLGVYFNTTVGETLESYWVPLAATLAFLFLVLPFVMYRFVLLPYQERASIRRRVPLGPPKSEMEAAIRRHCKAEQVDREELESLLLVGMDLDHVHGLEYSPRLKRLYLSANRIDNLENLTVLPALEALHVDDNHLTDFRALLPLRYMKSLRKLNLAQNPLSQESTFDIGKVVVLLPQLETVNQVTITPAVRAKAQRQCGEWGRQFLCDVAVEEFHALPPSVDRMQQWSLYGMHVHGQPRASVAARRVLARTDPVSSSGNSSPAGTGGGSETASHLAKPFYQLGHTQCVPIAYRSPHFLTPLSHRKLIGDSSIGARFEAEIERPFVPPRDLPDNDHDPDHPQYSADDPWTSGALVLSPATVPTLATSPVLRASSPPLDLASEDSTCSLGSDMGDGYVPALVHDDRDAAGDDGSSQGSLFHPPIARHGPDNQV